MSAVRLLLAFSFGGASYVHFTRESRREHSRPPQKANPSADKPALTPARSIPHQSTITAVQLYDNRARPALLSANGTLSSKSTLISAQSRPVTNNNLAHVPTDKQSSGAPSTSTGTGVTNHLAHEPTEAQSQTPISIPFSLTRIRMTSPSGSSPNTQLGPGVYVGLNVPGQGNKFVPHSFIYVVMPDGTPYTYEYGANSGWALVPQNYNDSPATAGALFELNAPPGVSAEQFLSDATSLGNNLNSTLSGGSTWYGTNAVTCFTGANALLQALGVSSSDVATIEFSTSAGQNLIVNAYDAAGAETGALTSGTSSSLASTIGNTTGISLTGTTIEQLTQMPDGTWMKTIVTLKAHLTDAQKRELQNDQFFQNMINAETLQFNASLTGSTDNFLAIFGNGSGDPTAASPTTSQQALNSAGIDSSADSALSFSYHGMRL